MEIKQVDYMYMHMRKASNLYKLLCNISRENYESNGIVKLRK